MPHPVIIPAKRLTPLRRRPFALALLLAMQAVAAWSSDDATFIVVPQATVSPTVAVSGTEGGCDGYPVGALRFKDGRLQLCRP